MLTALALASSLWLAASEAGARSDDSAVVAPIPVERVADEFGRDLYWLIGSNAADLYSTAWAIHRCPTCREGNMLGPNAEARIALKLASTASTGLTLWKLRRGGHNRAATVMRWVSVAANAAFVVNNSVHIIRRR